MKRYLISDWEQHPVTLEIIRALEERYGAQIAIYQAETEAQLYRARGRLDIINILKEPSLAIRTDNNEESDNGSTEVLIT